MGHFICCSEGELIGEYSIDHISHADYGGISDIVYGEKDDHIVFPHIDSCMGAILILKNPGKAYDRICIHLGFEGAKGSYNAGYDNAVNHYMEITRKQNKNIRCGVFIESSGGAWGNAVYKWVQDLKIENNFEYQNGSYPVDVWVKGSNIYKRKSGGNAKITAYLVAPPIQECEHINLDKV